MKKIVAIALLGISLFYLPSCSKTTGTIKLTYTKATAVYGDIDSLRQIPLMEPPREIVKPTGHFIGSTFVLIGERSKGIHIFDNNNLSNPSKIGFLNIPFNKEFYVEGNFLYAESGYDFLKIDISNLNAPVLVKRINNAFYGLLRNDKGQVILGFDYKTATDEFELGSPEAEAIKKEGKLYQDYRSKMIPLSSVPSMFTGNNGKSKGTINRICLAKNHVYVVCNDIMHIFSNSYDIYKVKEVEITDVTETIYTEKDRLFLGSETQLTVYDLGNPSNPKRVGKVEHEESCDPVLAVGDFAYSTLRSVTNEGCADNDNVLMVISIKKSGKAKEVQTHEMKSPYGLALINNFLFVGEGNNGLTIFDARKRDNLKEETTIKNIVAFDIMQHPTMNDIIITTNHHGLKEYKINWNTLSLDLVGTLNYH